MVLTRVFVFFALLHTVVSLATTSEESLLSIWKFNAGKTGVFTSLNYETRFTFPDSGKVEDPAEISVTRLIQTKEIIFWGRVKPTTTSYGEFRFNFSPKPGTLPHITEQVPSSSPPPKVEDRGKFTVTISSYGEVYSMPFDNYGWPSRLSGSGDWAEGLVEGATRIRSKPLLTAYGENLAWRFAAGILHTRPTINCTEFLEGAERMAELSRKFNKPKE